MAMSDFMKKTSAQIGSLKAQFWSRETVASGWVAKQKTKAGIKYYGAMKETLKKLQAQLREKPLNDTSHAFATIRKEIDAQERAYKVEREKTHLKKMIEVKKAKEKADDARKKLAKIQLAECMQDLR